VPLELVERPAVPDKRNHRGPAPEDGQLFDPSQWPRLRTAAEDLCWLLSHGYALRSSGELVGNRYDLSIRQRHAVNRCACSDAARSWRRQKEIAPTQQRGKELWIDGFNVLTGLEAALSGGVILAGCDGCYRDLAGVHARHHQVQETLPALTLAGEWTEAHGVSRCVWWLDRPISNSGRLRQMMLDLAARKAWDWRIELVWSPDKVLSETSEVIATADSAILDRCQRWCNLTRHVIAGDIPDAHVVDLASDRGEPKDRAFLPLPRRI
jgi:hypothetical protein